MTEAKKTTAKKAPAKKLNKDGFEPGQTVTFKEMLLANKKREAAAKKAK